MVEVVIDKQFDFAEHGYVQDAAVGLSGNDALQYHT